MVNQPSWFQTVFQVKGSVAIAILPQLLFFSTFAAVICLCDQVHFLDFWAIPGDLTNNVVYNLVLGLLLVFRTNTAYEQYWEGCKVWGAIVENSRNLAREIYLGVAMTTLPGLAQDTAGPVKASLEKSEGVKVEGVQAEKTVVLRWIAAFAIATKLHLRQEAMNDELKAMLSPQAAQTLATVKNVPLEIALWLGNYFQQQHHQKRLDSTKLAALNAYLNNLIAGLTSCERIAKTSVPVAYTIYLKRLIFIYCLFLPFQLVHNVGWWTVFVVTTVSFILLGVEEIGYELEDPFGRDANDLHLDEICHTILDNVEEILAFAPAHLAADSTTWEESGNAPTTLSSPSFTIGP